MTNNLIDLHMHSTASDGTLTPSGVAEYAKEKGLCAAALTDHDTVDGVREFAEKCRSIGIEPISGVEISARYKCEMHIIGLFVDIHDAVFLKKLNELRNARSIRNEKMLESLKNHGMPVSMEEILSQNESHDIESIGRPHIAGAMVKRGYVGDIGEAFDKYIGQGKSCYVKRITYYPEESIRMIKDAGGLAILAHPVYITEDEEELYRLLSELKGYGLDGAECFYTTYTEEFSRKCVRLCKRLDLLASGGSDFHGGNKEGYDLGCVSVDYSVLEKMKERLKK